MAFGVEVIADLNEAGDRIWVTFPYVKEAVVAAKKIDGYKFMPPPKGGPAWQYPLDIETARRLRDTFGEELKLTTRFKEWAKPEVRKEQELIKLANADDAELEYLPELLPELYEFYRPYQKADVKVMAIKNILNANHPGLGKTVEAIGSIVERGEDHLLGPHLIVAPKTSLVTVWEKELERWVGEPLEIPIIVTSGDDSPAERRELLDLALEFVEDEEPFFLVINPAFIRYQRDKTVEIAKGEEYPLIPVYPELFDIEWNTCVIDEYHLMGLANTKTNMFKAASDIKAEHKILLSGTPMGGKPVKLWGALHFLEPTSFTSKWRWAGQWLEIEEEEVYTGAGMKKVKKIHGVKKGMEDRFNQHLNPHMVRRTKAEVLAELPPKAYHIVECEMTRRQAKQYEAMANAAEVKIAEENLTAVGILAEYTRLKQFAGSHCTMKSKGEGKYTLIPTLDSGKWPQLVRLLEERGITGDEDNQWGDGQVVIASQFSTMVDAITEKLSAEGIPAFKITGDVNGRGERDKLVSDFQSGEYRVIVLSTKAGGVSITLDKADTIILVDETWDPDDQEQVEDRVHRISRIHQVDVFYLRTIGSIEEYIAQVTEDKMDTNRNILDLRRQGLRATGVEKANGKKKRQKVKA